MNSERWKVVRALFDELVELSPDGRTQRLATVVAADPGLGDAVRQLLDADAHADARLAGLDAALPAEAVPGDALSLDPMGLVGRQVARFRVVELIGAGGMGAVYRAEDVRLGRAVALKLPLPAQQLAPSGRARFLREARAVAALRHPNICEVHEAGEDAHGRLYLAMPHYVGETLRERIAREGALPESTAAEIARSIGRGLAAAHSVGIVHRDLKPANVMLLGDGTLKLLDFGLAKLTDVSVTATGDRLGTVAYMAPEQVRGGPVDARADLWALGVILYEMLAGRRPFTGDSDISVAHAILHESPAPPSRWRRVSPGLSDVVLRLLEREPGRRFESADSVLAALDPTALEDRARRRHTLGRQLGFAGRRLRDHRAPVLVSFLVVGVAALAATADLGRGPVEPDAGTSDSVALDLYRRGRDYERRGLSGEDLRSANALYRRALDRDTGFALARARLAIVEVKLNEGNPQPGGPHVAAAEARRALAQNPNLGDGHLAMGLYWSARSQSDSALAAFRRARPHLPFSAEVPLGIAMVHLRMGNWADAVSELERAREIAPQDLEAARPLAFTYSRLRRYEKAAQTWELVNTLVPDDYLSLLIKGYVYIRWKGTADTLAAVLRRIPVEWDAGGMKTWGGVVVARIARRPAEALAIIDSARWLVSADAYTYRPRHLLRAQVLDDLKDTAAARIWYSRLLELVEDTLAVRPNDPRLHIALGWARAGLGQAPEAVAAAQRAMTLLPPQANSWDGIPFMGAAAEVLGRAGDVDGAVRLLDSLLRMPAGREASTMLLRADPTWDGIRNDPRFAALLRRHEAD